MKTQEHAAVEKPQSKPGRKPLTSEPKNKRTAQNRAAQRAFRERKERRMKELEEKVAELEREKMQIENESELLRGQVSALMKQLNDVHGGVASSVSSSVSPLEDKLFGTNTTNNITPAYGDSINLKEVNLPSNSSISSSASMSYFGDGESLKLTPDSIENEGSELNLNLKNKLNNTNFKDHYDEQVFCNELGEACGSKGCPIPKAKSTISSIASSASSPLGLLGAKSAHTHSSHTGSIQGNEALIGDDYLSGMLFDKKMGKGQPFKGGDWNLATEPDFSRPNEMDFLFSDNSKALDTEKLIQSNPSAFQLDPLTNIYDSSKSDQYDFDFDVNEDDLFEDLLKLPQEEQEQKVEQKTEKKNEQPVSFHKDPSNIFDAGHLSDDDDNEQVPDNTKNLMHCSQIWERITAHPRFTEIDIDNLCDELKQKAKCSDTGVVVDGNEVGKLLHDAMKEKQQKKHDLEMKRLAADSAGTYSVLQGMW